MDRNHSSAPRHLHTSRRALLIAGTAGLGSFALHQAAAQQATPAPPAIPDGETFVGLADDNDTHVAILLAPESEGADRDARVYLCDGQARNVWLTGRTAGDTLDLQFDTGEQVLATVSPEGVSGTATLPDGVSLSFTAEPATGIAGLYEVVLDGEGRMLGNGSGGQQLAALVADSLADGVLLLAGVITLPDGTREAVAALADADLAGEHRWVVLPGGRVSGGPRTVKGTQLGTGFMDPNTL